MVARLEQDHNSTLLTAALPHLPPVPRNVLLGFLENAAPDQALTSAINDALAAVVANNPSAADLAAFARALSSSVNREQRRQLLAVLLQHPLCHNVELLAAIGSRCWRDLHDDLLLAYLEALARNEQGSGAFNALVADLLALPGLRAHFMRALASPARSAELATAMARLLEQARAAEGGRLQ